MKYKLNAGSYRKAGSVMATWDCLCDCGKSIDRYRVGATGRTFVVVRLRARRRKQKAEI